MEARFEEDQATIAKLQAQVEDLQNALSMQRGEELVSRQMQENANVTAQAQEDDISTLRLAGADALRENDKLKHKNRKLKLMYEELEKCTSRNSTKLLYKRNRGLRSPPAVPPLAL